MTKKKQFLIFFKIQKIILKKIRIKNHSITPY